MICLIHMKLYAMTKQWKPTKVLYFVSILEDNIWLLLKYTLFLYISKLSANVDCAIISSAYAAFTKKKKSDHRSSKKTSIIFQKVENSENNILSS